MFLISLTDPALAQPPAGTAPTPTAAGKPAAGGAPAAKKAGGTTKSMEKFEVLGTTPSEKTEATQIQKRKEASTVAETVGAEEISRGGASDASDVVSRVPAVTITDDNFLVVRGLNERYSSALLNGSRLPSTDPNRRVVPLNLFPADFIESLSVIKTYTPDLPGDFSGGLVDIRLNAPPRELTYSVGTSLSYNTATTFQNFLTYDSTALDWVGYGANSRDLPGIFGGGPSQGTRAPTTPQMQALVGALPDNWNLDSTTAPPNFGIDASVGNTWGPFGAALAGTYGVDQQVRSDEIVNGWSEEGEFENPDGGDRFVYDHSLFTATLGAILTLDYTLSEDHHFFGRSLYNNQGEDDVQSGSGVQAIRELNEPVLATAAVYTEDQLGFGQLEGRHHFDLADLDWRAAWAPSSSDQPDAKFLDRNISTNGALGAPRGERDYSTLSEFLQDYNVDGTVPFRTRLPFTDVWRGLPAKLKGGLAWSYRDRSFDMRRFRSEATGVDGGIDFNQPPDSLLIPSNYGDLGFPFRFREATTKADTFEATQEIAAFYGMAELPIIEDTLRVIGGARLEYSYIVANSSSPADQQPLKNILNDLNPLPGISVVYTPIEDMNVRAAFSQTVSRPEFRELNPTQFQAALGERTTQGNPFLISADITSWDLRWEWFFSPLELVSVGFFYKDLTNPIETIVTSDSSSLIDTFVNAEAATLYGFELEGRKNFEFLVPYARKVGWLEPIADSLADIQMVANVTLADSEATGIPACSPLINPDKPCNTFNPNRALTGQSPYLINFLAEYSNVRWGLFRLLYNTVGETVYAGGSAGLPDINERPRNALDFLWLIEVEPFDVPLTTKFAIKNILDDAFLQTQGDRVTNRYRTGLTFSVGVSYSY